MISVMLVRLGMPMPLVRTCGVGCKQRDIVLQTDKVRTDLCQAFLIVLKEAVVDRKYLGNKSDRHDKPA